MIYATDCLATRSNRIIISYGSRHGFKWCVACLHDDLLSPSLETEIILRVDCGWKIFEVKGKNINCCDLAAGGEVCCEELVEAEGDDENKIIVFPSDNTSALNTQASASAHQSRP